MTGYFVSIKSIVGTNLGAPSEGGVSDSYAGRKTASAGRLRISGVFVLMPSP